MNARPSHPLPDEAQDDRLGFVGTAGSGKTYNSCSAIERILDRGGRVIIPDPLGVWWGLRLKPDGVTPSPYKVVIFGGPHGDLPLNEHAGALIGETVATIQESCIIDLSELGTKAAERRFMLALLTALYRKASKEPVHLVFDEADMWSPQKLLDKEGESAKLLGMMETIVRRGRVKGFIPWLITQRPAVISKDVLSQIDGLVAFRLTSSQDRDAIGEWVKGQADIGQWKQLYGQLATLERGQGVVWLPARAILRTDGFPLKKTFDSSRTPKRGETVRTAELKPIDLGALKDRLAKVEAEAKGNDPKALKARIAELVREKRDLELTGLFTQADVNTARQEGYTSGFEQGANQQAADGNARILELSKAIEAAAGYLVPFIRSESGEVPVIHVRRVAPPAVIEHTPAPPRERPKPAARVISAGAEVALPVGEKKTLIALAERADGAKRETLTVLTGYKRSTRDAYIQRLRERGYARVEGDRVLATDEGIAALGDNYQPLPTGAALRNYWLERLPDGERKILEVLIGFYPDSVERSVLDERTNFKRSTRDAYIQRMISKMIVVAEGRGEVRASSELF